LRIARDGNWFYHGTPIGRKSLIRLFSSVLRRDSEGGYWLVTPAERGRIDVEDAPFTAVELMIQGAGAAQSLSFRTNVDDIVAADAAHPVRVAHDPATGEPRPYVMVRDGLEALILRAVFYEMVERGVSKDGVFGVWSGGTFFRLGEADPRW
jgi:hypothetical protein